MAIASTSFAEKDHDKPIPGPKGGRILEVAGGHAEFSTLTVSDAAFEFLMRRGSTKRQVCAAMKKAVQKFVGDAIWDALKCGGEASGILLVSPMNDRLMVN